ncbi:6957_t:CDS:2, partial [Gigaspora margarita]
MKKSMLSGVCLIVDLEANMSQSGKERSSNSKIKLGNNMICSGHLCLIISMVAARDFEKESISSRPA